MRRLGAAWWLWLPLLAAAAFYAPGFGGFWLCDDWGNLHRAWSGSNAGELWSQTWSEFVAPNQGGGSFLRPLMFATSSLSYVFAGLHYAGGYAFSFAVHLGNVALIAWLVVAWARLLGRDGDLAACLAALSFGLSPMLAEGVYWISARSDGWVTLCSLAALAIWMRDAQHGTRRGLVAYPALLLVGLGFKESAAVMPLQMALVAAAWPPPRPRKMTTAVIAGFVLLGLYFVYRAMQFPNAFETYLGTGGQPASMTGRIEQALRTVPEWWNALAQWRPRHGDMYIGALAVALAAGIALARGLSLRLAIALAAAGAGLAAATLYHLGGMMPNGEGGRLMYGPLAWIALSLGVLLAAPAGRNRRRALAAIAAISIVAGAALLHVILREVISVQDSERALIRALAQWAVGKHDAVVAIVPENEGPIVVNRNAHGGLVLPPVQEKAILHLVVPALPHDLPLRYAELSRGLGTRLAKVVPQKADAEMLREIHEPDVVIWPRVICWNPHERRLIELPQADHSSARAWLEQTRSAARACLPDEPSFASS